MELRKIVVGIDFSPGSEAAVRQACDIARKTGAELILVHAGTGPAIEQMRGTIARIGGAPISFSTIAVPGEADRVLVDKAKELGAELIVVGSLGKSALERFLLGSVASRVLRTAEASVLVVRPGARSAGGYQHILVPTDFSPHAEAALQQACVLAAPGGVVDLVHYWQMPLTSTSFIEPMPAVEAHLGAAREEIAAGAARQGQALMARHRRGDLAMHFQASEANAAQGIVDRLTHASSRYDIVIMGSHGRRGFRRWLLGSVAEKTVHHVPCSVLVVHLAGDAS
jgi:nucleotide-binding universal stress UspA family protein